MSRIMSMSKRKEAGLATRPSPVFEQLLLSYCSVTQPLSCSCFERQLRST
jgi:hypothetical protein